MNLKSKLAYMALGGVLVLAGHVLPGLVVPSATAQGGLQDAEFNDVTVRKLTVVDETTGTPVAVMGAGSFGGRVSVYQPDGAMAAYMTASAYGGSIAVAQPDGKLAASMGTTSTGGIVTVRDKYSKPGAGIYVNDNDDGIVFP